MTTQNDINKDMVSLVGSLSDSIQELRKAVVNTSDGIEPLNIIEDSFLSSNSICLNSFYEEEFIS